MPQRASTCFNVLLCGGRAKAHIVEFVLQRPCLAMDKQSPTLSNSSLNSGWTLRTAAALDASKAEMSARKVMRVEGIDRLKTTFRGKINGLSLDMVGQAKGLERLISGGHTNEFERQKAFGETLDERSSDIGGRKMEMRDLEIAFKDKCKNRSSDMAGQMKELERLMSPRQTKELEKQMEIEEMHGKRSLDIEGRKMEIGNLKTKFRDKLEGLGLDEGRRQKNVPNKQKRALLEYEWQKTKPQKQEGERNVDVKRRIDELSLDLRRPIGEPSLDSRGRFNEPNVILRGQMNEVSSNSRGQIYEPSLDSRGQKSDLRKHTRDFERKLEELSLDVRTRPKEPAKQEIRREMIFQDKLMELSLDMGGSSNMPMKQNEALEGNRGERSSGVGTNITKKQKETLEEKREEQSFDTGGQSDTLNKPNNAFEDKLEELRLGMGWQKKHKKTFEENIEKPILPAGQVKELKGQKKTFEENLEKLRLDTKRQMKQLKKQNAIFEKRLDEMRLQMEMQKKDLSKTNARVTTLESRFMHRDR